MLSGQQRPVLSQLKRCRPTKSSSLSQDFLSSFELRVCSCRTAWNVWPPVLPSARLAQTFRLPPDTFADQERAGQRGPVSLPISRDFLPAFPVATNRLSPPQHPRGWSVTGTSAARALSTAPAGPTERTVPVGDTARTRVQAPVPCGDPALRDSRTPCPVRLRESRRPVSLSLQ